LGAQGPRHYSLQAAQLRSDFEIRLPSYVPPDVQETFFLDVQDSGPDAVVTATYYKTESNRGVLRVTQGRSLEVISIGGAERVSIGHANVFVEYPFGSDPNEIVVKAYVDGLFYSVEYLTGLSRPAEELRSEALRVVTSILDQ
jgi:hypothetical protein